MIRALALPLLATSPLPSQGGPADWVEPEVRVIHVLDGEAAGDQFGYEVADAGDADGDSVHDIVVGAPFHATRGPAAGCVYLYSGRSGELLWRVEGQPGDLLGWSVAAAGDADGDGRDDVVVGAPQTRTGPGRAAVLSGLDGSVLRAWSGEQDGEMFGDEVEGAGDWDGDGKGDVVVGASGAGPGRVLVLSTARAAPLAEASGEAGRQERFGSAVDAWADGTRRLLVVGAPAGGERGRGRIYLGRGDVPPAPVLEAGADGRALGSHFVSVVGDVDGDGTPDVLATDWQDSRGGAASGRVVVLSGADGSALLELAARAPGEGFGIGNARVGDVDGDGRADLLVGAWTSAEGAPGAGKVYLLSGASGAELATVTSRTAGEGFGFDATGLGDVDGDGHVDWLVSAATHGEDGSKRGRVYVIAGHAAEPRGERIEAAVVLHEWRGDAAGEQLGWVAQDAGDLDGDGVHDVLTSAPFRAVDGAAAGRVVAYSGANGERLFERLGRAGDQLGRCVCGLGDVDGDGHGDFAAGAPGAEQGTGRVLVWSGKTGAELRVLEGLEPGGSFGLYLAPLGDLDGDGRADLAVAAPTAGPGLVLLYSGATGEELGALEGERDGDAFGSALGVGGPPERRLMVVGAKDAGAGRRGCAYVYRIDLPAPEQLFVIEAQESGADLGRFFVSVVGDVDADGIEDVYAADFADSTSPDAGGRPGGRIYVHSGADGRRLASLGALQPGEGFGIGDARAGDLDGDGHADLIVGAWTHGSAAPAAGRVYLLSGKDFSVLRTITSAVAGEGFGFDATGLPDLDGDGVRELLVTAAYHPAAGPQTGRVLVISGALPSKPR